MVDVVYKRCEHPGGCEKVSSADAWLVTPTWCVIPNILVQHALTSVGVGDQGQNEGDSKNSESSFFFPD